MNEEPQTTRSDATVQEAIGRAVEQGRLKREDGEQIFWLHGYGLQRGLSNDALGKTIGVSKGTIAQLFGGTYAADYGNMIKRIAAFRRGETISVRHSDMSFVETSTAKMIWQICDNAFCDKMPAFVYGCSQVGKTRALTQYVLRQNNPAIKYLRCRSGMTLTRFARLLADQCHLRNIRNKTNGELIDDVSVAMSASSLLILDEFHLCMETVCSQTSRRLVEYVREIYDNSHCGLVLCMTKVGLADLEDGPNAALFDQLRRRGILKVVLPDVPPVKDVNAFAAHFGLAAPRGEELAFVKRLVRTRGLGVYLAYLAKAKSLTMAEARSGKGSDEMTWEFFESVARGFESLANIKEEY